MYYVRCALEANLQDATIRSVDQPSGFGTGESYRPKSRYIRQREPGRAFVRSPGSGSSRKRGRVIGGDHHGPAEIVSAAATSLSDIAQAEDRARYRRGTGQRPCHTAIAGNRSARIIRISRVQIAAAHDSVVRIAEIDRERT